MNDDDNTEIKHVVVFKYKSTVTILEKDMILRKFLALKHEAKKNGKNYIVSLIGGYSTNSLEGLNQGFEQTFIVTFKNRSDLEYYIGQPFYPSFDPIHDQFKQFIKPFLATDSNSQINGAMVFDFETIV